MARRPPLDDRELLKLIEQGHSSKKIAEILNYPRGTVRSQSSRWRERGVVGSENEVDWMAFEEWKRAHIFPARSPRENPRRNPHVRPRLSPRKRPRRSPQLSPRISQQVRPHLHQRKHNNLKKYCPGGKPTEAHSRSPRVRPH